MRTIYKYPIDIVLGRQDLRIPHDRKFLAFQLQEEAPTVWYEVEEEGRYETVAHFIYGTGHDIQTKKKYLGTIQQGPFVWHLYTEI